MKPQHAILLAFSIATAGCDGYVYSFRPPPGRVPARPPDEHLLLAALRQVASERGYVEKPPHQPNYGGHAILAHFGKSVSEREWVAVELVRELKDGSYRFIILDWPSITRSDESRAVEAALNARLQARQTSNKSLEPTALWRCASTPILISVVSTGAQPRSQSGSSAPSR